MKKPTFSKAVFAVFILLLSFTSIAQTFENFKIRHAAELKGDMLVVGNNLLAKDNNPLNDNSTNETISMQYIDIDSDASTFNSSSADLAVPSTVDCFRIAYAGLYWGALIKTGDSRTDIEKIKLKLPGSTTYTDINGEIIYDAVAAPIIPDSNQPYACYADVTSIISGLTNSQGTYTVANVKSSTGSNGTTGLAAGWTLYVIYEDPKTTTKYMVSYDGFSALYDGRTLDIDVGGFQTAPSGAVNLKFGFATLNGDKSPNDSNKTKVEISNGTANGTALTTALRPSNYFFNSSITNLDSYITSRNPNGTNTLGYDTGIEQLLNVNKSTVGNNATNVRFTLQVARGQANPLFSFFNAFQVNVIAPDISLTKLVKDISGNDIGNTEVGLGTNLYYEIGFQSTGNDNITNFTLKDVLPNNVVFNYPSDIISLPTGVTHTYNATTRELLFSIPNDLVEVGDFPQTIRLHVQVVSNYRDLLDACANEIKNQAFASYRGVINTKPIVDEGSFSSTVCNFGTPSSTNFLVNIDGQTFSSNEVLCGASVQLSGPDGYDSYSWSTSPSGTPVIGTNQNYTATDTGTYYITSSSPCATVTETITVNPFGNTITNPVIPYADEVVICPNNGKELPNIFLCGANATRLIQTNISDASTIEWEKLNESSCAAQTIANCPNENTSCQWNIVGTGANFLVNTSGQFRVTLRYPGGCFSRFYFNVYQNILNPTYTTKDIVCATNGNITIGGVPSGYEYSLDGVTYQSSNVFTITTAGAYTVYIKQVGVTTNPCIFSVPNILIRKRVFSGSTIVTQPLCNGDKGSIKIAAVDADPQYYYSIYQGTTLVNSYGPIADSEHEFSGLNPATYTVRVWTSDGCDYATNIQIIEPAILTATSALTKPLTCVDGEITVYPVGGTPPYAYYVNGSSTSQSTPQIVVTNPLPSGGIYNIQVVDSQNCSATTSITVAATPPPVFTISQTNNLCYGSNIGEIQFNVSNANGYTLAYSIDNGVTYLPTPTFSNLTAGTYNTIVRYTLDTSVCYGVMEEITITGPASAVTASAGVSELAGCTLSGQGGKIRITNPQGGVAPYLYSFDNQATWVTTNEADMLPGTYTLYVKDANGCIYPMPNVILDPKPVPPTIDVASPVFNCDGSANTTVTVTNSGGTNYEYGYLLDGTANTNVPSNVFVNVPSGSHTVSVTYKLLTVPTYSNLLKEDFGSNTFTYTPTASPDASSPGINPAFCWERQVDATKCNADRELRNGEYTVTSTLRNNFYSGWNNPVDHTAGSATGRYLAVDAGTAIPNNAVLYRKTIKDIIPNQPIQVRFFATNLLKVGNTQPDASLTVELQDAAGVPLSSSSTGGIPKTNGWVEYNKTIDPGSNTTLDFVLRLEVAQVNGIDFAVDDIEVYQLPKSCITQVDFPFVVPTGKAFTGSVTGSKDITCAGADNGEITLTAVNFDPVYGFDYSIDGGTNWVNSKTSPVTITGLSANTYTPLLRFNAAGDCPITLTPATINTPTPIIANASVTQTATCTTGATITASATGGTPAYQYELRQSDGVTVVTAFNNNPAFTNVPSGDYTVFVRDINLCTTSVGIPVSIVAPPSITATLASSTVLCYTNANPATLVVNVVGGTAPFTYSLDGAAAQTSNTFTNVGPGTHTILVTDSKNCTATISDITIGKELLASAAVSKALDCSASPNANIDVTIIDGTAPYTYKVKLGSGSYGSSTNVTGNTFTYSTATVGTYIFEITDAKGCITTTTATINPITNPTASVTATDPICNNGTDGQVQIVGAGGSGGFEYSFNGGAFSSTSFYTGLNANTTTANTTVYTYQVRDSKQCLSPVYSVTLNNPTKVVASATIPANTTCNTSTVVTVSASGGAGGYTYSFNGSTTYTSVNTLEVTNTSSVQNITYSVKDIKGCIDTQTIAIPAYNPPTGINFSTPAAITCTATTTSITLTAVGGIAPLTYTIVSGPTINTSGASSGTFTGLLPGNYVFQVTDANNCTKQASTTINPAPIIAVSGVKTNVKCFGATDGTATFTITGASAVGNYTYTLSPASGSVNKSGNIVSVTGLGAGTYTLQVVDVTTGCSSNVASVTINPAAQITFTLAATNINCNNKLSTISFPTLSGGTPGYTYAYAASPSTVPTTAYGTSTTVDTSVLTTNIDVYVKDLNGCIAVNTVTIINDVLPTVTASADNQCTGSGSGFTITAVGTGLAPLTYSINGTTFQTSNIFTVVPGTYTITVKDKNGCTAIADTPTIAYPALTASAILTKDLTCSTPTDATIDVTVTGGKASFGYRVKIGAGSYSGSPIPFAGNTFTYSTSAADTFQFEITDANGCTKETNVITTTATVPVTASFVKVDPTCNGFTDGSIKLTATAGEAPFTYSIDGGTTFVASNVFGGLAAGSYDYIVRDNKGCDATGTIILDDPAPIAASIVVTDIICNANTPGSLLATIDSGGIAPFTYTLYSNTFTQLATSGVTAAASHNFTGLTFGDYYITIVDAKGCEYKSSKQRIETPPFLDLGSLIIGTDCINGATVKLEVISGGVAPYKFSIFGQPATTSPAINAAPYEYTFFNLLQGTTYYFQVEDANLCTSVLEVVIPPISTITLNVDSITDVTCSGSSNGILDFTVSGFDATVSTINYEILDALTNAPTSPAINGSVSGPLGGPISGTISSLPAGDYLLKVTESAGTLCSAIIPFSITQPVQPLASTITSVVNANCNSGAQLTLTTTGGTGPYTYAVAVAPTVPSTFTSGNVLNLDYSLGTNWNIIVKDANGCTVNLNQVISKDAEPTINPVALQCYTGSPLSITLSGNVAVGTPMYSIGGVYQASPTFTINAPGIYNVSIKDGNGCIASTTYEVKPQVLLQANLTQDLTCITDASITLTPSGGTGIYTPYEVSINGDPYAVASSPYTTNVAGSYVFRVYDNQVPACPAISNTVVVTATTAPTLTYTKTNVSCNGGSDGSILVTPANGISPYTFAITGPIVNNTGDTSGNYTGLKAGSYDIVVTDAYGCTSATVTVVVTEPVLLTATASYPVNTTCSVGTVITVVGHDGTPTGVGTGYYYSFDNGVTYDTSDTLTVNDNGTIQTIWYSVKDANGCITSPQSIVINPLDKPIDLDFALTTAPTCPSPTATVTLTATKGVNPLQYETISPSMMIIKQASNVFTGLISGDYTFQVTDANGCTYQELYRVDPVTKISVRGQLIANMTCNTGDDGKVSFDVSNFSGNYTYTITKDANPFILSTTSSAATIPLTGLGFGVYKIDVIDNITLCTSTVSVTVAQPSVVTVALVSNTNANCTSNALVKVAGGGGTPDYIYAYVVSGAGLGSAVFTASDSASLDPAISTSWDFYAKDVNGCVSAPLTVTITTDPLPTGFTATASSLCPNAAGTFDITVNVGTGMGPFEYSIGSGFQSSPLFTVNVPKAYDLIVKDKFGCTANFTTVVTLLEPIALQTNITALPSCANNDGVITVSATGGSGNYEYKIDSGTYPMVTPFTGVTAGSHTVYVRDTTTGCEVFVPITLTPATPITGFALSQIPVSCNGGNDGTITATMATPAPGVNDNPVYMYSLNGGTPQVSNIFTGLTAGTYTVDVISGRGCTDTASIPVTEPDAIVVPTPTVVPFNCISGTNVSNFATITVNGVDGGSGSYIYEFFKAGVPVQKGASNVYTVTDLSGGDYTVTVYDNKGCIGSATVPTIASFIVIDKIIKVVNQAINCTNPENITVTAVDASGVAIPGIQYSLVDVSGVLTFPSNTDGIFTGLAVGNYMITATNPATGCSVQDVHYVSEPNTFDLTIDSIVDVTCFSDANGSANVTIIDRNVGNGDQAGAFNYTLVAPNGTSTTGNSTVAGPLALSGLVSGTYTITATLTNNPFCSVSKNFTITGPTAALNISETHTAITCIAGNNDGTITAAATGGWPGGYEFQLELSSGSVVKGWSSISAFTGLTAGDYIVKVRDSKGCVDQEPVTLVNPTPIVFTATPSTTTLSCFGDRSASISASLPTGGQGSNYLYTLNTTSLVPATANGPQTSPVFNGLGAGTYTITVTDGYSCSATSAPITISEPTKVIASLVVASTQTCGTLTTLALSATGGTGSYSYSSDGINYTVMTSNPFTLQVAVGTYHYYVRDANGCSSNVSNDIKIDPLVPLTINLEKANPVINCAGDSNGVITATAEGGLGNYSYILTNMNTGVALVPQSSGDFTGLVAGDYKIHVDSGDCSKEVLVTITQPLSPFTSYATATPVTCNGNGDGKIVITAGGGTGEIRYAISPIMDQFFVGNMIGGHSFNNLKPGFYDVISQDQNGCFHLETVEITEPNPIIPAIVANSVQQELCSGEKTGAFSISITGGVGPYSTSLDDPNGTYVLDQVDFTGLSGGDHTVYIKDANTCTSELVVSLNPPVTLNPVATVSNECVNDLPANKVTVTIDPSNIPSDVTYSLDSTGAAQSSNVFTNLTPGSHFIMVQHKNGCVDATDPFVIDQIEPLTISIDLGGLNEIVATVTGGSGVYQFSVNGESIGSNNKYHYFRSGDYTVTVTDSNGCSLSATKYFEFIDIKIPPIFTPTGDGTNDTWKPTNTENYPDIKFIIYDRYGRQVGIFGAGQSWDGKYDGTELPMGDYWYILKLRHSKDDREFVGHFTLYR